MLPKVTVVICTYNRTQALRRCIASICQQDYPADLLELVVIDDGSSESKPNEIIGDFSGSIRIRQERIVHGGLSIARQRATGIIDSSSEIVGLIDDDCIAAENWVWVGVTNLRSTGHDAVTGNVKHRFNHRNLITDFHLARGSLQRDHLQFEQAPFILTGNVFFRADSLYKVSLVNPVDLILHDHGIVLSGGDDRDLTRRMFAQGMTIGYEDAMIVWHEHRSDLRALLVQVYGYGFSVTVRNIALASLAGHELDEEPRSMIHHLVKSFRILPRRFKKIYMRSRRSFGSGRSILISCVELLRYLSFTSGVLFAIHLRDSIKGMIQSYKGISQS